jgi:hypothetical protein
MNVGDVKLGEIAEQIGAYLKSGALSRAGVGKRIRDTLCQH